MNKERLSPERLKEIRESMQLNLLIKILAEGPFSIEEIKKENNHFPEWVFTAITNQRKTLYLKGVIK